MIRGCRSHEGSLLILVTIGLRYRSYGENFSRVEDPGGMLVVSLRNVNCRFWCHLVSLGQCPFRYRIGLCIKNFTKNAGTLTSKKSNFEKSSRHFDMGFPLLPAESNLARVYMRKELTPLPEPTAITHGLIVSP